MGWRGCIRLRHYTWRTMYDMLITVNQTNEMQSHVGGHTSLRAAVKCPKSRQCQGMSRQRPAQATRSDMGLRSMAAMACRALLRSGGSSVSQKATCSSLRGRGGRPVIGQEKAWQVRDIGAAIGGVSGAAADPRTRVDKGRAQPGAAGRSLRRPCGADCRVEPSGHAARAAHRAAHKRTSGRPAWPTHI